MITELYEEFGPSFFTNKWRADPGGLLAEAVALLADLRLVHIVPGGILVRPAAGRYATSPPSCRAASTASSLRPGLGSSHRGSCAGSRGVPSARPTLPW
ncbi:hypothetical protein [Streptomyces yanii]|uniref:Uncharacterized protein n=1 Tax=Streptomyces yanii TaxID=78510 RepID=A0ABV5QYX5_9ACTN